MLERLSKGLKNADLNRIVQEICAVLIGVAMGLYGYESKVALLPLKWETNGNVVTEVAKKKSGQESAPKAPEAAPKAKKDNGFNIFGELEKELGQIVEDVGKEFVQATGAENLLKFPEEYSRVFEDLGIRGELKGQVENLIRDGVEPVPKKWTSAENQPFFILAIAILLSSLVVKFAIYLSFLDVNRLKTKIAGTKRKPEKRRVDWNGILQEIGTLGVSVIGGLYLQPALEELMQGEMGSYPYPFLLMAIFVGCISLKMAVSSTFLDLGSFVRGKSPLVSARRLRKFSRTYDWNGFVQQISTIVVSLGLGFYAYESNLALLPIKWKTDRELVQEVAQKKSPPAPKTQAPPEKTKKDGGLGSIFGEDLGGILEDVGNELGQVSGVEKLIQYTEEYDEVFKDLGIRGGLKDKIEETIREGVDPVPNNWTKPGNIPYLVAALAIFVASLALKFLIYFRALDFNAILKRARTATTKPGKTVDWNEIVDELTAIILGTFLGLYAEPLLDTLAGETAGFPYPRLGPCIIFTCLIVKLLLYLEIIDLASSKSPARKAGKQKKRNR